MVSKIVDRYVKHFEQELPITYRRRAGAQLREVIYDTLNEYCGGDRPVSKDAYHVLREIGPSRVLAREYKMRYSRNHRRRHHVQVRKLIRILETALLALSVLLILTGLILYAAGTTGNLKLFIAGGILGVILGFIRMLLPEKRGDPRTVGEIG